MRGSRIVIPSAFRSAVLGESYDANPGVVRMKALARAYCWGPVIDRDIVALLNTCAISQQYQKDKPAGPIHLGELPDGSWERVHTDYYRPIEEKMLLLLVDAYTESIDVRIVPNATSETTINKVRTNLSIYGMPKTLVTDNGSQFTSAAFEQYLQSIGIHHMTSTPCHPASNGLAERAA